MDKVYNHKNTEDKIYESWEKADVFTPTDDPKTKPFAIIMPPPNANDPLHIGHAMFVTIEDILIRYHRMQGDATLWLPGTDHAGIETQFVFEKKLKKEGKSRFDFDRQTLYKMIWDYVQENSGVAVSQMKKLGASADWSRFKFTLDPKIVEIVLDTFQKLHKENLIYRDYRLVNYCTRCGTGFSELEVLHEVRKDPLLYIKYGEFTIATVRPETKFRDTALAVYPTDVRYKDYVGKSYEIMGLLGPTTMKVIADGEVDPKFGTGIMKVTPAHDFHDYELGKKYDLPITPIIDFKGKMDFSWFLSRTDFATLPTKYQERAKQYHGLHVSKARPLMTQHLKDDGLIVKINENYEHTVTLCYRCKSLLEPLPLAQFFVKVRPLANRALTALENNEVKIHGAGYDKILKHWLTNLKDWNISRQIVWGVRLPVWYEINIKNKRSKLKNTDQKLKMTNHNIEVTFLDKQRIVHGGKIDGLLNNYSLAEIKSGLQELRAPIGAEFVISTTSPGDDYIQETDTFDTWFSSGQWPIVALASDSSSKFKVQSLKFKEENPNSDFNRFYPTQVMETAYDILIFWVMRMLMLGLFLTDKVPFQHIYLHGLVRDEKGQKMSKSKGNVINPLDIVEKYGADALRMALVMSTTAGIDSSTGETKIRGMRNFTNKIWNAARFILLNQENSNSESLTKTVPPFRPSGKWQEAKKGSEDEAFYKKLNEVVISVTKQLEDLKVGLAAETVYNEFWHWFCDVVIEKSKTGAISQTAITEGFTKLLKLLHPFVPFVTEDVWSKFNASDLLITSDWPA